MNIITRLKATRILANILIIALFSYLIANEMPDFPRQLIEAHVREAMALYRMSDYEHSIEELRQAEHCLKFDEMQDKNEKLADVYFYLALNFSRQRNLKVSKAFFKQAFHSSLEKEYDASLMDDVTKKIYREAKIEFERESAPQAMGIENNRNKGKGTNIVLKAVGIVGLIGVWALIYSNIKKSEKEKGALYGDISVNSDPDGARVYLDGADTGELTPCALYSITGGTHSIRLEREGFKPYEQNVEVKPFITVEVDAFLMSYYEFVTKWGTCGSGNNQLDRQEGLSVDNSGNVYVADTYNYRIMKFTSNGSFMAKWGSKGSGINQFDLPYSVTVDNAGLVYVADKNNDRIMKFTSNGNFIAKWDSSGGEDYQFYRPGAIAADEFGYIYVADSGNDRIMKYTTGGNLIIKWGGYGSGNVQFNDPKGIAVDKSGNVFVADTGNHRITKFTSNGNFMAKWGSYGSGINQFDSPGGVAVDKSGDVYVADTDNHRILKFTSNGNFITRLGSEGGGNYELRWPEGVAVHSEETLYVADTNNCRIMKFQISSETLHTRQNSPSQVINKVKDFNQHLQLKSSKRISKSFKNKSEILKKKKKN